MENNEIDIGTFEGVNIIYDNEKKQFVAELKGIIIRRKDQHSLQKEIAKHLAIRKDAMWFGDYNKEEIKKVKFVYRQPYAYGSRNVIEIDGKIKKVYSVIYEYNEDLYLQFKKIEKEIDSLHKQQFSISEKLKEIME